MVFATIFNGCTDETVQNAYSRYPANFVFRQCAMVPQMKAALGGSPGSFFTVRATADNKYIITSNDDLSNPYTYQRDALDQKMLYLCRSGFIIGTPALSSSLEAYDLACPNCFRSSISRPLTFETRTPCAVRAAIAPTVSTMRKAYWSKASQKPKCSNAIMWLLMG